MATTRPAVPENWAAPVLSGAALARDRLLPVVEPLSSLLPDGGLVRGQAIASSGPAALSLALAAVSGAVAAGSWLAVVDVPMLGLETAAEFGIPLERIVRVDPGHQQHQQGNPARGRDGGRDDGRDGGRDSWQGHGTAWAELMTATIDGFEVVITRVPAMLSRTLATRVQARWKARGAVVVVVGRTGPVSAAVELESGQARWEGIEPGAGHLRSRRVVVEASGRRTPRPRRAELWLPGPDGVIGLVGDAMSLGPAYRTGNSSHSAAG